MGKTFSGTYLAGITLSNVSYNPVSVTGTIDVTVGIALYATAGSGWTITNQGVIESGSAIYMPDRSGIVLAPHGSVMNQAGGTISGYSSGIDGRGASTIVNGGIIAGTGTYGEGVLLFAGGTITNQSSAVISGGSGIIGALFAGTVVNAGSISGSATHGSGIALTAGGTVINQSNAFVGGADGISGYHGAITVINAGNIAGATAVGYTYGLGLYSGGSVTNQSAATISGFYGIVGGAGGAVAVVNAGTILGSATPALLPGFEGSGIGVLLRAGGSVTNQIAAVISGFRGIYGGEAGALTVVNGGTISGSSYAVQFAVGQTDRVIVDPGAVFTGSVNGGNTAGSSVVSTLELASGASSGTLSGLGTQFIDFAQILVDPSANWTLGGSDTLVAGTTLTDSGTLNVGSSLSNGGSIAGGLTLAAGATFINVLAGTVTNTSGAAIYSNSVGVSVTNVGSVAASGTNGVGIYFVDGGTVNNAVTGGVYSSQRNGVLITDASGTVSNAGIISTGIRANSPIGLHDGGTVSNASTGTISTSGTGSNAIYVTGGAGTVINAGVIIDSGGVHAALNMRQGAYIDNVASGTIIANAHAGIYVYRGIGTVVNAGLITSLGSGAVSGIAFAVGGSVTNQSTGRISANSTGVTITGGVGTVVNAGTISVGSTSSAVQLQQGGYVSNTEAGVISGGGGIGVLFEGAAGTLNNAGVIMTTRGTHGAVDLLRARPGTTESG